MAFFFFGTLRDPDVLTAVLARRPAGEELISARLADHRTVRAAEQPYPLLIPARGATADGVVLLRPSHRDERRISWFEEDEYRAHWRLVETSNGRLPARVFLALAPLRPSSTPWDYQRWRAEEKADYLARCAEWMEELGDG